MPVSAVGGEKACGDRMRQSFCPVASNEQSVLMEQTGHWPVEEQPEEFLRLLLDFLKRSSADADRWLGCGRNGPTVSWARSGQA